MHDVAHDERMRRLQQLAYGAVASDADRAAAVAELEELRRHCAAEPESDLAAPVPSPIAPTPLPPAAVDAGAEASARPFRWAIAAGAAALLVGVVVGWQVGTRVPASAPETTDQALGGAMSISVGPGEVVSVPVTGSVAYATFDRPASATDTLPVGIPDDWVDPASVRLLATTPDGLAVFGAKAVPGGFSGSSGPDDVCLVIVKGGRTGGTCTRQGVFADGEIWTEFYREGDGLVRAEWHADGAVLVSVPGH